MTAAAAFAPDARFRHGLKPCCQPDWKRPLGPFCRAGFGAPPDGLPGVGRNNEPRVQNLLHLVSDCAVNTKNSGRPTVWQGLFHPQCTPPKSSRKTAACAKISDSSTIAPPLLHRLIHRGRWPKKIPADVAELRQGGTEVSAEKRRGATTPALFCLNIRRNSYRLAAQARIW